MLYDFPQYYEIAFSFRDIAREAEFLIACMTRYSSIPVERVFEIACGTAPHAGELAHRGYQYTGLDLNRNMLDYAAFKWRDLEPATELIHGDMIRFNSIEPMDFAFVMLGSLYLNNLDDMTSHFECMARTLRPGGLYFLDWCVQFNDPLVPRISNTTSQEINGIRVDSRFNTRLVDPARQMYEEIWTVNVDDHGRRRKFEMIERNRAIFPQEFLLFLETRTDFEFVGWWHDWDFSRLIGTNTEVVRPVVLIRRR
jgi:SAM-dependent methyltransferase